MDSTEIFEKMSPIYVSLGLARLCQGIKEKLSIKLISFLFFTGGQLLISTKDRRVNRYIRKICKSSSISSLHRGEMGAVKLTNLISIYSVGFVSFT